MTAPTETATAVVVRLAERATAWLDEANGRGLTELYLRCYKVVEEYGEVCDELSAQDEGAAVREAVDVIAAAVTAQVSLGHSPGPLPSSAPFGEVHGPYAQVLVLRLGAAIGRAGQAINGWSGQNPRKGRTKTTADVVAQLDEVTVAAVRLIAALGVDPEAAVVEHASRVLARLDELGVSV